MQYGYHIHTARKKKKNHRTAKIIDMIVYAGGPLSVVIFFPQLFKIWFEKNVSGVSALSWAGILGASIFWIIYGIIHREKPIIFVNVLCASVTFLIVLGIFIYSK